MDKWISTRKSYINWLSDSELRGEFSKKIVFENLSLWWLTNLMDKDNINETLWYEKLNEKLNLKKSDDYKKKINYFFLLTKLLKDLFFKIFSIFILKLFFRDFKSDIKKSKKRDCFYALYTNCVNYDNKFIDRQYGLTSLQNLDNKYYIIELPENFFLLKNFFKIKKNLKKIPLEFIISNKNLKIMDIFKIYYFSLLSFLKLMTLLKKKNYFFINKVDCSDILKYKLLISFFGSIQNQLLRGKALESSLVNISTKNFINCFDFHPQARSFYYFAKKSKVVNVININHANYSENNIFFNYNKRDFSKNYSSFYSPKPDIFFAQGERYYNVLKNTFEGEKIFCLGSLKPELNKFRIEKKDLIKSKNLKKTFTILCSINDYKSFVKILNECNFRDLDIYVAAHPLKKIETIKYFKKNLKNDFIDATNLDKTKIFRISDQIIFGDTSLGLELYIKNYNVLRLYCSEYIPTFDIDDEIPTATNKNELLNLINNEQVAQNNVQIEKNYFYKYDMKASDRLEKILSKLN